MPLSTLLHPGAYHGTNRPAPFFEGWYYKLVSADEKHTVAIIPGVILGEDAHAFVQVLDGADGTTAYHRYPFGEFLSTPPRFSLQVGDNRFDGSGLSVRIDRPDGRLEGDIRLDPLNPWPVTPLSPGIMGWFAWVPRMECYHGVLSFDHALHGSLTLDGVTMDFTGGRGYIEKDWGQAFPAAWVWFQSNHFDQLRACITASVAVIPWLGHAFRGFIIGLWLDGTLHRFATYTGARIESLDISDDSVAWTVRDRRHRLEMHAGRVHGGLLLGPTRVDMGTRVHETLNASIRVRLTTLDGRVLFDGTGRHAGLEAVGDLPRLSRG